MINKVMAAAGQSVSDIATQRCGTRESMFAIALLNGLGITDALQPAQVLDAGGIANQDVADYFRRYNLIPATATTLDETVPQGVDFWAIEFDFIVS